MVVVVVVKLILGWCGQKWLWPSWSQGECMNEWMNWADFSCWCKFKKIRKSLFQQEIQHPILLPKDCRITNVIVSSRHDQVLHAGRGITINQVRLSVFWVIGLNIVVRSMISKCVRYKHLRGRRLQQQKMDDLPRGRMSEEALFTSCGVDMFGPFVAKNQGGSMGWTKGTSPP